MMTKPLTRRSADEAHVDKGGPLVPGVDLAPGDRLDRYELLAPVARGGMASVWVARFAGKHGFEKLVAIKTILPEHAEDARFQRMLLDEARIAAGIEHVNVAQILDLGEQSGVLYLALEWVDGDNLQTIDRILRKRGTALPVELAVRLVADVCGGLHAAHELRDEQGNLRGVIHRDISPHNLMVTSRGVAKLIDFGVAKARDRLAGNTNTGIIKGKLHYLAPEHALGRAVDRRADIWSMAATLYYLLTGGLPFDEGNQVATIYAMINGKPPKPLPERVPKPIADVVCKALARDPNDRYPTALAMQEALEAALRASHRSATPAQVAAFLAKHAGDVLSARQQMVARAIAAAGERERTGRSSAPSDPRGSLGRAPVSISTVASVRVPTSAVGASPHPPSNPPSRPPPPDLVRTGARRALRLRDDAADASRPPPPNRFPFARRGGAAASGPVPTGRWLLRRAFWVEHRGAIALFVGVILLALAAAAAYVSYRRATLDGSTWRFDAMTLLGAPAAAPAEHAPHDGMERVLPRR